MTEVAIQPLLINAEHGSHKGATIFSTSVNLANTVIGAGVLCLGYTMHQAGAGLALCLMICVCLLSVTSFIMLSICCEQTGTYNYRGIAKKVFGHRSAIVVEFSVFLYTASLAIGYVVLLGHFLPSITKTLLPESAPSFLTNRNSLLILLSAFILYPLTLFPKLDALKYTSVVAVVGVIFFTCSMVYRLATKSYPMPDPKGPFIWWNFSPKALLAIPLMAVSFTAHYSVPVLYQELDRRSPKRFAVSVISTAVVCLVMYSIVALTGYASFTDSILSDVIENYAHNDILAIISRFGLSFSLAFGFPVVCFSMRCSFEAMFLEDAKPLWRRQFVLATLLVGICVTVAILEERIEVVLGLAGGSVGLLIGFVFPGLFFLYVTKESKSIGDRWYPLKRVMGYLITFIGIVLMVFCTYLNVQEL
ncbi:hypothetical protein P9112_003374 [Eukaryota sp. TZLM1-RC]